MTAVGSYIRTLRDKQGVTRARMAEDVKTTENTLWRIETGKQKPGIPLLSRILAYVHGSIDDVAKLAAQQDATAEDGQRLAEALSRIIDEEGARPYLQTADDTAELIRYIEEEFANTYEEDRRSLGDALRVFLAGFRAARRRNDE